MKKILMRSLCALLSVLMLACMLPALAVSAAEMEKPLPGTDMENDYIKYYTQELSYASAKDRLATMQLCYENKDYALYCDPDIAVVAYEKKATGEVMFTNPWDWEKAHTDQAASLRDMMSQVIISYLGSGMDTPATITSFTDAITKGQFSITNIQNGVRVEYAIGEISSRILLPMRIEKTSFEEKIQKPLQQAMLEGKIVQHDYLQFMAYYTLKKQGGPGVADTYPVTEKKNIDIYVYNDNKEGTKVLRKLENLVLKFCPDYSFAQMAEDYEYVEYEQDATSPPVFRLALEYTIDDLGLSVTLPANGLRYDETAYRITDLQILPYMGATYKGRPEVDKDGNPYDKGMTYEGYSFLPDGSGALYDLSTSATRLARVYGDDYALLSSLSGYHTASMRMPVFGQVGTVTYPDGSKVSSGYFAIIEQGDALASIGLNHTRYYTTITPSFIIRQRDTSKSNWQVYASRRYTDDYKLRYIILSDDAKAQEANLSSYYECSWMGMACAYRDYLSAAESGFDRLTAEDVENSIPLYIETFGCMDTVKKIMSVPVTVSVALTSFDDIEVMYEYLLGEKITNVNFKMTGYANGGLYSDVPYKLKWEKSVGGKSGFADLLEYAADHPELGLFPDFDFVYTKGSDSSVNMKKYAARTVDNRYTSKRTYSVTQQTLVSHFEMVLSPATFSHFYEKLEKRYAKYGNLAISLSTMGSDLNSSFNEEDVSLREDSKHYTVEALDYFADKGYEVMVDGGNAFTWSHADYILDIPLDSSRYTNELSAVPFMGVVLHGYVQFAGSPLNMEGNLTYAMLKAMESGAGVYFVISYTNTELLKEDELLSQNYSVRYDIWRARLVEIYNELNAVLSDVQTKLIVRHEFLNRNPETNTSRVPDEDELLQDALAEAEKQAAALKEKIEKTNAATVTIEKALEKMEGYRAEFAAKYAAVQAQRASLELMTAWEAYQADKNNADVKNAFLLALTTYVAEPVAELMAINQSIDAVLAEAKVQYNYLVTSGAEESVRAAAEASLSTIIDRYVEIRDLYVGAQTVTLIPANKTAFIADTDKVAAADLVLTYGKAETFNDAEDAATVTYVHATDRDGFLYGTNTAYNAVSVETLLALYVAALDGDSLSFKLADQVKALAEPLVVKPETEKAPAFGGSTEISEDYKYATDSDVVLVTYGDYENGEVKYYKSIILNFNDYAVTTTLEDGTVYNIEAYGYAVIMHQ